MMETMMRKPRDYDAELKVLEDRARELKARKVQQLGELVIATGADAFTPEELAGALIVLSETKDAAKREAWSRRGASFFRSRSRRTPPTADRDAGSTTDRDTDSSPTQPGVTQPAPGSTGAA
jgi:DNA-binding protein H-NS